MRGDDSLTADISVTSSGPILVSDLYPEIRSIYLVSESMKITRDKKDCPINSGIYGISSSGDLLR
ncbi:hypothetical protein DLD82_00275 [Methanospirillum stamsii]|uniref:Uncharacterized protein n=1 Tax=Methanospirillum stamsii TaxID=1277351 RepID=A0A2V2NC05_9EURY|nr:hypothetical protein DLD82_00275 [Methanospirillum stamsii]